MRPVNSVTANLSCFAAMVMWALSFPAAEVMLQSWDTVALACIRQGLASTFLLLLWWYRDGLAALLAAPWLRGMTVGGVGFGLGSLLLLYGQELSDPVTPAIAAAMMPIAGAILEIVLDRRKLSWRLLASVALALSGGLLASGAHLSDSSFGTGALLCLAAVFLFAWATRATTRHFMSLSTIGRTTLTLCGAWAVTSVIFILLTAGQFGGAEIGLLDTQHVSLLLLTAIASMAIAQLLWIWGAGWLGILVASIHMNAVPFYVMVMAVVYLSQPWQWTQALGGALVMAGVLTTQLAGRTAGRSVQQPSREAGHNSTITERETLDTADN